MIHEYAVDPALLCDKERFRYLTEHFGVHKGRLISRYPKRWKRLVYKGVAELSEMQRKWIEDRLATIDEKMVKRKSEWIEGQGWLNNAEFEHTRRPFHAILAMANPSERDYILTDDDLDEEALLWKVESEITVSRSPQALASAVAPLLRISRKIFFIDPYIDPYKPRSRKTLEAFLRACLVNRPSNIQLARIEFHTKYREEIGHFFSECERQFPKIVPTGYTLRILRWEEKQGGDGFHNRYILTERGGIRFTWGLDAGSPAQTDDLSLCQPEVYKMRWNQFFGDQPAFDLKEDFEIAGKKHINT